MTGLSAFDNYQEDIVKLASLSSPAESPILTSLSGNLKKHVDARLKEILSQGSRGDAEAMVNSYGDLLSALELGTELVQVKLAHLSGDERMAAIQEFVASDKAVVEEKLAAPALNDPAWESELLASLAVACSVRAVTAGSGR